MNLTLFQAGNNNTKEINYLRHHSPEYAHSVFYGLSNALSLHPKKHAIKITLF